MTNPMTAGGDAEAEHWPQLGRPADEALMDMPEIPGWDGEEVPDDAGWPTTMALRFYMNDVRHWTENGHHYSDLPNQFTPLVAAHRGIYMTTLDSPPDTTLLLFGEDGSFLCSTDDGFTCGGAEDLAALFGALARQLVLIDDMSEEESV